MMIGARIRQLRKQKRLTQGDIEKKTGLLRCYISLVENGHKVPTLHTLGRFASALDIPTYRLFYEGNCPLPARRMTPDPSVEDLPGTEDKGGPDACFLRRLRGPWIRMGDSERQLLMELAKRLATREQGFRAER